MAPKRRDEDYPRPKRYKERGHAIDEFIDRAGNQDEDQITIKPQIGKTITKPKETKEWTGFYLSGDTARKLENLVSKMRNIPGISKRRASKSRAVEAAILLAVEDFDERVAESRFVHIFLKQ